MQTCASAAARARRAINGTYVYDSDARAISYRHIDGNWTVNNATYLLAKDYFFIDTDTSSLQLGRYNVKVNVEDPIFGGSVSLTETNKFKIMVNPDVEWIRAWSQLEGRLDPGGSAARANSSPVYSNQRRTTPFSKPHCEH